MPGKKKVMQKLFKTEFTNTFDEQLEDQKDYKSRHFGSNHVPIVIDNGSYKMRVGWGEEEKPRLQFQSMAGKMRGNSHAHHDIGMEFPSAFVGATACVPRSTKIQWRTAFDTNVVVRWDTQETLLDFSFVKLGVQGGTVDHPILFTEPMCNLSYSRSRTTEMFFECYNVPSLCYGIDSAFALYDHARKHPSSSSKSSSCSATNPSSSSSSSSIVAPDGVQDGVVIACGHNFTHIYAVLDGNIMWDTLSRISVGGSTMTEVLQHSLLLSYPNHRSAITPPNCDEIKHNHCYLSLNYDENVLSFDTFAAESTEKPKEHSPNALKCHRKQFLPQHLPAEEAAEICGNVPPTTAPAFDVVVYQLPIPEGAVKVLPSQEELETKKRKRQEAGERLKIMQEQRREQKLAERKFALESYEKVLLLKGKNEVKFAKMLQQYDIDDEKDLKNEIKKARSFIQRTEALLAGDSGVADAAKKKKSKTSNGKEIGGNDESDEDNEDGDTTEEDDESENDEAEEDIIEEEEEAASKISNIEKKKEKSGDIKVADDLSGKEKRVGEEKESKEERERETGRGRGRGRAERGGRTLRNSERVTEVESEEPPKKRARRRKGNVEEEGNGASKEVNKEAVKEAEEKKSSGSGNTKKNGEEDKGKEGEKGEREEEVKIREGEGEGEGEEEEEENLNAMFPLLAIPDTELSVEDKKKKRVQKMQAASVCPVSDISTNASNKIYLSICLSILFYLSIHSSIYRPFHHFSIYLSLF